MKLPSKVRPYLIGFAFGFFGFVAFAVSAVWDAQLDRLEAAKKGTALERGVQPSLPISPSSTVQVLPLEPSPFTPALEAQQKAVSANSEKANISKVVSTSDMPKPAILVNPVQNNETTNLAASAGQGLARAGQLVEPASEAGSVLAQNRTNAASSDADLAARATRNAMLKLGYRFGSTPVDAVKHLQAVLKALGYYTGPNSGVFDARTRAAVAKFQRGMDRVKPFGFPNQRTVEEILSRTEGTVGVE